MASNTFFKIYLIRYTSNTAEFGGEVKEYFSNKSKALARAKSLKEELWEYEDAITWKVNAYSVGEVETMHVPKAKRKLIEFLNNRLHY